jgi:4-aminobutyrate aminotransferase-like enzyme
MTTAQTLSLLRQFESRNVTFLEADGSWPIVWERAQGCHVWDAEGRKYLDLTAAFGVAAAGHANPRVVRAGQRQMATLLHAMGDVHPHALKAQLARELSELTFGRWAQSKFKVQSSTFKLAATGKAIFCNSGFEAVEAALKTARLATGKPGIIAFEGGYHGLGYGALNATHREHFRGPFRNQLREFARFLPYPEAADGKKLTSKAEVGSRKLELKALEARLHSTFRRHAIGAILVEPMQARGGIRIPPPKFLQLLRRVCDQHGALLILDEIYTGFGRTGAWFACEHSRVVPDLICLGKALTGGFPLSACVGRADVMDAAWPPSTGEAIHTSTFLGHPVGCAMALAQIKELKARKLVERAAKLGAWLEIELREKFKVQSPKFKVATRCVGLMAGIEFTDAKGRPATELSLTLMKRMLHRGFILLPEGEHSNILSLTPPLTIPQNQLSRTLATLSEELAAQSQIGNPKSRIQP